LRVQASDLLECIKLSYESAFVVFCLSQAAHHGHAEAQTQLAYYYEFGRGGCTVDARMSFELLKAAASQGFITAMQHLAQCYYEGKGTEADQSQAAHWTQLALQRQRYWDLLPVPKATIRQANCLLASPSLSKHETATIVRSDF
jgi:hypothetical protein